MSQANRPELLRRHRIVYHALQPYLSDDQMAQAVKLWESEFSHEGAFRIFGFYRRLCEELKLKREVAATVNNSLIKSVNSKLEQLLPTPFEAKTATTTSPLSSDSVNCYQTVKNTIGEQIGFKDAEKIMERQLLRLGVPAHEFSIAHLEQSMTNLKGAITLYCKDSKQVETIVQQLKQLILA